MTAILGYLGPEGAMPEHALRELLALTPFRGQEHCATHRVGPAVLGAAWDGWEMRAPGSTATASRAGVTVVADATLYYVDDLRRTLASAGHPSPSSAPAELILSAYLARDTECPTLLEGDFAFVVADSRNGRLFAARDPFGLRSLFVSEVADGTLLASTSHPLVRAQGQAAQLDPSGILRALLMRPGDGRRTAWTGVHELPAGFALAVTPTGRREWRYFDLRIDPELRKLSPGEAVLAARERLDAAVRERLEPTGTVLALSGGMDSTAVLASAAVSDRPLPQLLSYRYPTGDPGDEAWYVEAVAQRYEQPVGWIRTDDIPLLGGGGRAAWVRANCHGHLFEGFNRTLARRSVQGLGTRVLLNGHGGDNVFGIGAAPAADLLRSGRLLALARYVRTWRLGTKSGLMRHVIRPALPLWCFDAAELMMRRRICSRPFERPTPAWVRADPRLVDAIWTEDREDFRRTMVRAFDSLLTRERAWALSAAPFFRANSALYDLSRDEGVELRMPFHDQRLVSLSLARPPEEFVQPGRHKLLLARAVEGRLPERSRTAQRGHLKPGSAVGMVETRLLEALRGLRDELSTGAPWILEALGLLEVPQYLRELEAPRGIVSQAADLSMVLLVERWARTHLERQGLTL